MSNRALTNRVVPFLVVALLAVIPTAAEDPAPSVVGSFEPASIKTPFPYPVSFGSDARTWEIRKPGATYIRVHFSNFQLADGDSVEVFDPNSGRSAIYTGRGLHDAGDFWALTILGDTAMVRMQATTGGDSGFSIDGFGAGFEPIVEDPIGGAPDSVCGANDWEDVACYSSSDPMYESARAAVKLLIGCCSACTGWKASDTGQFMTNNHCVASTSEAQSTDLLMEYQANQCGGSQTSDNGVVSGTAVIQTDYTLDYTLMSTTGNSSALPCLELSPSQAANGSRIFIAHHPNGGPKKLSVNSDVDGGPCIVNDNAHNGRGTNSDIAYYCDTIGGSSGSPVLDYATHQVIAAHHFGGCLNSGGRSDLIWDDLAGQGNVPSCDGGGGGDPYCGDGSVNQTSEECDGSDLNGQTCSSLGLPDGALSCYSDCTFDSSDCTGGPTCVPLGDACSSHSDCCTGKCRGRKGGKICR